VSPAPASRFNPDLFAFYAVFIWFPSQGWDGGRWAQGQQIRAILDPIPAFDNAWVSIFDLANRLVCFDTTENAMRKLTFGSV
jgi:hypothetical protein